MNRFGVLNLLIAIGLIASVNAIDCNNPPARTNLKQCCPHGNLFTKDIIDKCKEFLDSNESASMEGSESVEGPGGHGGPGGPGGPGGHGGHGGHRHHPPTCFFECALNQTGIFKDNNMENEIDEVKLKSYLAEVLSETPDFTQVVQNAFDTCAKKGKEMRAMMEKDKSSPPTPPPGAKKWCKPCAAGLLHCVQMETMFNCPATAWKNDDPCNNNREFIKTCKPDHPPHGKQ